MINDRYAVDSIIGKGSSGTVYKATRLMMGGVVAVKVIDSYLGADRASLDRLIRELKAAEKLRHPHIITVWESGITDDGQPYLVMDYLEGITLGDMIKEKGALSPNRVLSIFKQVCDALSHAHEQGLIHRDMKPENVVLEENEKQGDYAKVLDFGIADTPQESAQRARFNKPQTVAGSPAYMSPEQCQGFELDFRSDLYSMAVMVFEMFTGRRPFVAPDLTKLMYKTVTEKPPTMQSVYPDQAFPPEVEAVVAKALAKNPADRQPSVKQFWQELEAACKNSDFGKKIVRNTTLDNLPFNQHEFLPSERLIEPEPKKPQFAAGPEDMPELFMDEEESPSPASPPPVKPQAASPPPMPSQSPRGPSTAPPPPSPGLPPGLKSGPPPMPPPSPGSVRKSTPPPMPRPRTPQEEASASSTPVSGVSSQPPVNAQAKPASSLSPQPLPKPQAVAQSVRPQNPLDKPVPATTPSNGAADKSSAGLATRSPSSPSEPNPNPKTDSNPQGSAPLNASQSMGRLSALVKPTSEVKRPDSPQPKAAEPSAAAKTEARPPSVYSYVPPKEKKIEAPLRPQAPANKPQSSPSAQPRVMGKPSSAKGSPGPGRPMQKPGPGGGQSVQQRPTQVRPSQPASASTSASPSSGASVPSASSDKSVSKEMPKPGVKTVKKIIKKVKKVKRPSDLDGNLPKSVEKTGRDGADKLSKISWEDEIEALKTGNFEVTSIPPQQAMQADQVKSSGQWPVGTPLPPGQMPPYQYGNPYAQGQPYPAGYPMPPYDPNMPYPPQGQMPPQGMVSGPYQQMPPQYMQPGQMPPQGMMPPQYMHPGQMTPQGQMPPQGMMPPPYLQPGQMPPQGQVPVQGQMPPGMMPQEQMPQEQMSQDVMSDKRGPSPDQMESSPSQFINDETRNDLIDEPSSKDEDKVHSEAPIAPQEEEEEEEEPQTRSSAAKDFMQDDLAEESARKIRAELEAAAKNQPASNFADEPSSGLLGESGSEFNSSSSFDGNDDRAAISSIPNPLDQGDDLLSSDSVASKFQETKKIARASQEEKVPSTGLGSLLSSMSLEADELDEKQKSKDKQKEKPKSSFDKDVNPLDLFSGDPGEGSEFQTLDISKGQKVAFSKETVKKKSTDGAAALGNLLNAHKAGESSSGLASRMPEATNAISSAVDDMFPDDTMGADSLSKTKSNAASLNSMPTATNDISSAVDKWLDSVEGGIGDSEESNLSESESKPKGISAAAAKLSEALSMSDDDVSDMGFQKTESSKNVPRQTASTSTSDALSRLLEAASNAPETSTRSGAFPRSPSDINDMMQSTGEHDSSSSLSGVNPSASLQKARGFGDASAIASSNRLPSSSNADKYGQDAVNARIAALNQKLDLNSNKLDDVELPKGMEPTPSVFSGAQRRDAVNRILEEANAHGIQPQGNAMDSGQYPVEAMDRMQDRSSMQDQPAYSLEGLENIGANRLAQMADAEVKSAQRGANNLRSKQGRKFNMDLKTPVLLIAVLGVLGFIGFKQGWLDGVGKMLSSMTAGVKSGGGDDANKARDAEVLAKANELFTKGQLTKGKKLIEKYNADVGLTPELESKLDEIYIGIANYQAKKGSTDSAINELKKVPKDSSHFQEAQDLIKQYSSKSKSSRSSKRKGRSRRR